MTASPCRSALLGAAAAMSLLLLAAPTPSAAVRQLRDTAGAADSTGPLVALVAVLAWGSAAWLLAVVAVTAGGQLPGQLGRWSAGLARRVAPAAVRHAVEVALGLTVAAGVLGASPALASPATSPATAPATAPGADAAPAARLDRSVSAPVAGAPSLDWPGAAPSAPPAPAPAPAPALPPPPTAGGVAPVVVRPGDTLWGLAEQDLESRGAAAPSDRQVATAWPAWWAANREAVGHDPDLLLPGTTLTAPELAGAPPEGDGVAPSTG